MSANVSFRPSCPGAVADTDAVTLMVSLSNRGQGYEER